MLCAEDVIH